MSAQSSEIPENRLLSEYKSAYLAYVSALAQIRMTSSVAALALADFPKRLPKELRHASRDLFKQVGLALFRALDDLQSAKHDSDCAINKRIDLPEIDDFIDHPQHARDFANWALELMIATAPRVRQELSLENIGSQFESLARRQAVTMVFAHLDAFMGDTLRIVCRSHPEVLRTKKTLTWEVALQFSSMDELITHIIDQFVYEFGWAGCKTRLDFFKDRLGIEIDLPCSEVELINLFEQRRHVIMHNGGIANLRYMSQTSDSDAKLGEPLLVHAEDVDRLIRAAKTLGSELCVAVAVKFLGAEEGDLSLIWRRSLRTPPSEEGVGNRSESRFTQ